MLICFFKWLKLNLKPYPHSRKNHKYPVQAFILKLKHLALKLVNFIKKPTKGKVDKMAQSEKKRVFGKKQVSKTTKIKFGKRLEANYLVLNKLTTEQIKL
jgi:hypothetical protein